MVHIDFNVCFEKGTKLRVPEIVPFRYGYLFVFCNWRETLPGLPKGQLDVAVHSFCESPSQTTLPPVPLPDPLHLLRLTQMLVSALGPSGPDGLYRSGLESSLAALRSRREGVTALLDSVLGDPGVDWSTEREDAAARCASDGRGRMANFQPEVEVAGDFCLMML